MFKAQDWKCITATCGLYGVEVEEFSDTPGTKVCPACDQLMERVITAHAGYKMKGNNSSSQTPRGSGSFPRRKNGSK